MELMVDGKSETIPPGSHVCQLYSKPSEVVPVSAHFIGAGLREGDRCQLAAAATTVRQVLTAIDEMGVDTTAAIESEQLEVYTERLAFLKNETFDPYHLVSSHRSFLSRATRSGYKQARIAMDMSWLARDVATPDQLLKYEAAADSVFTFDQPPIGALIQYDYTRMAAETQAHLFKLHPIYIVGKFIKRNPHYIDSEQYLLRIVRSQKNSMGRPNGASVMTRSRR